jgi:hypothetical protein
MAIAYANSIRAALLAVLKTSLPAVVNTLGLEPIHTWESKRVGEPSSSETPALVIRWAGWQQPYTTGEVFDAGESTQSDSIYRFYVWLFYAGADEEVVDEQLAGYAEAIRAVLDDVANCDLGGVAQDVWTDECTTSPAVRISGDDRLFRATQISVRVWKTRILGTYSD